VISKEEEVFKKYFPEPSVAYCLHIWKSHSIQFTISKPRKSIFGVYRFKNSIHQISVNGDLNPHAFLVTFLHEVAHLLVRKSQSRRVQPHGKEWQNAFREIMQPVLIEEIFPKPILSHLIRHLEKPSATTCSDETLYGLLMGKATQKIEIPGWSSIAGLSEGTPFSYGGRHFLRLRQLRKRIECIHEETGTFYRFHPEVHVKVESHTDKSLKFQQSFIQVGDLNQGNVFRSQGRKFKIKSRAGRKVLALEVGSSTIFAFPYSLLVQTIEF
jgi:hypothetical protein